MIKNVVGEKYTRKSICYVSRIVDDGVMIIAIIMRVVILEILENY